MEKSRCFWLTLPSGSTVRVRADKQPNEATAAALDELIGAAVKMLEGEEHGNDSGIASALRPQVEDDLDIEGHG